MFQEGYTFEFQAWDCSQETHKVRRLVKAFLRKEEGSIRVKVLDLEVNLLVIWCLARIKKQGIETPVSATHLDICFCFSAQQQNP